MKKISGIILGALLYFSFASSASAALHFNACFFPGEFSTTAQQQQYNDCLKSQQGAKVGQPATVTKTEASTQTQQPSGLTEPQIQSIVMLLQAFGADQAVVVQVEAALRGKTVTH